MNEQACRVIVYQRSQGRCEVCGRPAESVHHRNKQGRVWTPDNTLHLCGDGTRFCHGWLEAHPDYAIALGLWVPRAIDPATRPAYCWPTMFRPDWWFPQPDGCWGFTDPPDHDYADALQALRDARDLPPA